MNGNDSVGEKGGKKMDGWRLPVRSARIHCFVSSGERESDQLCQLSPLCVFYRKRACCVRVTHVDVSRGAAHTLLSSSFVYQNKMEEKILEDMRKEKDEAIAKVKEEAAKRIAKVKEESAKRIAKIGEDEIKMVNKIEIWYENERMKKARGHKLRESVAKGKRELQEDEEKLQEDEKKLQEDHEEFQVKKRRIEEEFQEDKKKFQEKKRRIEEEFQEKKRRIEEERKKIEKKRKKIEKDEKEAEELDVEAELGSAPARPA